MNENHLQTFNTTCVKTKEQLKIFFEKNKLRNITLSANINQIHAFDNEIEWIYIGSELGNMNVFNISKNRIKALSAIIKFLDSSLNSLDVSNNFIGKLNINTFAKFNRLKYLSLRNTSLSNIEYGTFHNQQDLLTLYISYNNLEKIDFDILQWSFNSLETIYLNGNLLDNLDNLNKHNFPLLKYSSVDQNNFNCSYLSKILQLWKNQQIMMICNPNLIVGAQKNYTHINGINCYHNSADSSSLKTSYIAHLNDSDSNLGNLKNLCSNKKVEYLLMCIAYVY